MRVEIDNNIGFMQAMFPIIMSAAVGARLILSLLIGSCNNGSLDPVHTLCNKYSGQGGMSISLTIELMFIPIVTFCLLRDTRFEALLTSWFINCVVILTYCIILKSADISVAIVLYLFFSTLIYADSQSRLVKTSGLVNRLQDSLAENERLAVEAQAIELRAMIGNIAHDLKSVRKCTVVFLFFQSKIVAFSYYCIQPTMLMQPLTSFLSGLECVLEVVSTWEQQLNVNHEQFMSRAYSNLATIKKCLQSMSGTNSFMTMTINRCLDYTKASKGFKLVPTFSTVLLELKLSMTSQMIHNAHPSVDINIQQIDEGVCSHIITDKQWLMENLLCLLSNAAKYSHQGHVDIAVALEKDNHFLRFEVQDTGVGMSDEAMQDLFKPFKQAQRLAGGTGLGLFSLAKRVEALQGSYGVMRRPDGEQGSVFWFTIPYRPDETSSNEFKQRETVSPLDLSGNGMNAFMSGSMSYDSSYSDCCTHEPTYNLPPLVEEPLHVLVVDDAPLIVKMTTMLLQRKGHIVQHAVNGADALDKLCVLAGSSPRLKISRDPSSGLKVATAQAFDVVLMDLQMPVLDGIEAIRRLRAAEDKQNCVIGTREESVPTRQFVIALSANSDEETKQEALAAGADAFMSKPFTYEGFSVIMADQKRQT